LSELADLIAYRESLTEIRDILHSNTGTLNNIVTRTKALTDFKGARAEKGTASDDTENLVSKVQNLGIGIEPKSSSDDSADTLKGTGQIKETTPMLAGRMIEAIQNDETDLIDSLLLRGYDVNYIAPGNMTPLVAAVKKDNLDLMERLLECDADTEVQDGEAKTALC
jgi:hypothetical protein